MIAEKSKNRVSGGIVGDVARMTIDVDAMSHIMDILTDLYSDSELAILREYSTNAHDAHVEAGTKRPIEVRTPSNLDPYLRIRDFGTGLSVEDVHAMYSRYGASTKRGTNEQTGMLGLGSKSALTYAAQFTLTSVKDGVKIVVLVSRDEDGGGSMTIPDTRSTDELNGTEVTIPAKRDHTFDTIAADFFRWWNPGTVLVNGKAPAWFGDDPHFFRVSDSIYVYKGSRDTIWHKPQNLVVMGNVAYPFEPAAHGLDSFRYDCRLIHFVPIGTVQFAPNREALRDTHRTKETLTTCVINYRREVTHAAQREVDAASTGWEALAVAHRGAALPAVQSSALTWRGQPLPAEFVPRCGGQIVMSENHEYSYRGYAGSDRRMKVAASVMPTALWVYDFVPATFTKQHKMKMRHWCDEQGIESIECFVMLPPGEPMPSSPFIDPARVIDWSTIRSVKLASGDSTPSYRRVRLSGSYDLLTEDGPVSEVPAAALPRGPSRTLAWVHGNQAQARRYDQPLRAATDGKFTLACLPGGRIKKFKRDFPHARPVVDVLQAAYDALLAGLNNAQKMALAIYDSDNRGAYGELHQLDPDQIVDPVLRAAVKSAKVDIVFVAKKRRALGVPFTRKSDWKNPLSEYPLYQPCLHDHPHTYLYLNCVYRARSQGESHER